MRSRHPSLPTRDTTYSLVVVFSVARDRDADLRDSATIRAEVQSWLESLDATVHRIVVHVDRTPP